MFPTNLSNNVSERKKAISGKVGCLREKWEHFEKGRRLSRKMGSL
jgi:hypothetical protein